MLIRWALGAAAALGAALAWLGWQLVGEVVSEALWRLTAPVRRPLWRLLGGARWPWPAALLVVAGAAVAVWGLRAMRADAEAPGRLGALGLVAFFGGAALALVAPLLWRDARRARLARSPWSKARPERG